MKEEEEEDVRVVTGNSPAAASDTVLYDCYAISNHSGTMHGGHYTAYCRHPAFREEQDEGECPEAWHLYNDRAVSSTSPDRVVTAEAYLMFFERKDIIK